ncbi:MAG TPA: hypothetical protein V6D29_09500 [Leptolyngbyaceae cyanobacterium]
MVYPVERSHPQHPHHLECPHCGRHTIVVHGEGRYACLNCGWHRDIAEDWAPVPIPLILLALFVFLLVIV